MPAPLGVTDLSRDAMPRRLNVRVPDGELEVLDRASAEMGCSRSQVMRLSDRPSSSSDAHAHAVDQSHIGAHGTRHGRPGIPSRRFRCRYSSDGDVLRKAFPERAGAHEIFHSLREVTQSHATRVPCEQGPHAAFVFFQMKERVEQGGLVLDVAVGMGVFLRGHESVVGQRRAQRVEQAVLVFEVGISQVHAALKPEDKLGEASDTVCSRPNSAHTKKGQRLKPLACFFVVGWTGFEPATP